MTSSDPKRSKSWTWKGKSTLCDQFDVSKHCGPPNQLFAGPHHYSLAYAGGGVQTLIVDKFFSTKLVEQYYTVSQKKRPRSRFVTRLANVDRF